MKNKRIQGVENGCHRNNNIEKRVMGNYNG